MKYATFHPDGTLKNRLIGGVHTIPKDAVEITEALWVRLVSEEDGVWTRSTDGTITKQPLPQTAPSAEAVERQRLAAYANIETGSDRYFSEATRMQTMGEPGWEAVRDKAVSRFHEIQALFPWPEDMQTK